MSQLLITMPGTYSVSLEITYHYCHCWLHEYMYKWCYYLAKHLCSSHFFFKKNQYDDDITYIHDLICKNHKVCICTTNVKLCNIWFIVVS